ncbi:uncharacterized protein CDAR_374461 [Caerostris darwini]|uniref:Uncharacterized protein n=1 Tax=Caerostris darwini TaxID=1538125 RepID=A0AAV4UI91_9ARAC|nr:uncharacterized protein CDAR_374461 [Caerostris darwini]
MSISLSFSIPISLGRPTTEAMNFFTSFPLLCILSLLLSGINGSYGIMYNYFDDFLSSLNEEEQARITGISQDVEGSGSEPDSDQVIHRYNLPLRTGLTKSKDVTCCSLGHLAGDKGYHCVAKFYAARIRMRNMNRAHNRKLGFHGLYSIPNYGTKLMRTFEQCVATRGMVFHKCCNHAAMQKSTRPHFDTQQRKRYEMKMRRIRIPWNIQVDSKLVGI